VTKPTLGSGETKLETAISYLLICGVIISVLLISIGIALYYGETGNLHIPTDPAKNPSVFIRGDNFFAYTIGVFEHLFGSQNALVFVTVGLAVLILTPYVRAIASVLYFALEKNLRYVLITLFVLIVLTVSLALH
jgi:uncharacterized membrane protein